jgi:hypothetical protein
MKNQRLLVALTVVNLGLLVFLLAQVRWTPLARPKIDDSLLLSRQPFLALVAR